MYIHFYSFTICFLSWFCVVFRKISAKTKNNQNLEYISFKGYYNLKSIYQVFNLFILNNLFFNWDN